MKNKKNFIIVLVLALTLIGALTFSYFNSQRIAQVVLMNDKTYEPTIFSIKKNSRVVFKNQGSKPRWPASDYHPTHGIYPEFDPQKEILPGSEWSFVFKKAGKWKFHDHLQPSTRGTVTVTE